MLADHHLLGLMDEEKESIVDHERDDAARAMLHKHIFPDSEPVKSGTVITVEDVAKGWHKVFEKLVASCG
jgi:hypothetical protein